MRLEEINREFWELSKSLKDAQTAFTTGNFAQAEELYRKALELCEKMYGDDHEDTCTCLQNLSDSYYALKKYKDAIPLLRRLLIAKQKVEAANAEVAGVLFKLSKTYEKLGQTNESDAFYRCALKIGEQVYGSDSTFVSTILESFIGMLRRAQIRLPEADQMEERVRQLRGKLQAAGGRDSMGHKQLDALGLQLKQQDTISPGQGPSREQIRLDSIPPGSAMADDLVAALNSIPTPVGARSLGGERLNTMRFQPETGAAIRPPNSSQVIAAILGMALVGFLCFCIYGLWSMKTPEVATGEADTETKGALPAVPMAEFFGKKDDSARKLKTNVIPIYSSPDGVKQLTILDTENVLLSKRGIGLKATYTESKPYIIVTPEGQSQTISFERTADTLVGPDGTILYSESAPETVIITEMKTLAQAANKYYRKWGRYPGKPDAMLDTVRVISYENPFTHQPVWPTRRLLLGIDDETNEVNVNDYTSMKSAVQQLKIWRANETMDPGTVEYYRLPGGPGNDALIIRGSDRTGHMLKSSKPGYCDVVVCTNGRTLEF